MKYRFTALVAALLMLGTFFSDAVAAPKPGEAEPKHDYLTYMQTYTPLVLGVLSLIHKHEMTKDDRYLILDNGNLDDYVQCIFHDNDTQIYCEASSGYYQRPHFKLKASQRRAIAERGFDMDGSHGNYKIDSIENKGPITLTIVAQLMLETLYWGYGEKDIVNFHAPLLAASLHRKKKRDLDRMYHIRRDYSSIQK